MCWYSLHGMRSVISLRFCSDICRRETVSIAGFHVSKHTQHRLGQDKKRWVSPLKRLSEHKLFPWNAFLMLFVSEQRFQWVFQELFINWDTKCSSSETLWVWVGISPLHGNPGQTCTSFGTALSHYFQVCSVNLHNSSSSSIFMSFKYKWTANTFSESSYKYLFF